MSPASSESRGARHQGSHGPKLPWWCRALLWIAARRLPAARRLDFRREWSAELLCFARGPAVPASRLAVARRTLACFADARQIRRLHRAGAAGALQRRRRAPLWSRMQPLRATRRTMRGLARSPVFAGAAVVTLALGIGANTAIFSLVNGVALKPPAVERPDRLVRIYTSTPEGQPYGASSYLELQEIASHTEVFEGVTGYTLAVGAMIEEGRIEALLGEVVTADYFGILGVPMALGRGFRAEEGATPGTDPVVVLGYGFWTRRFGADTGIIGRVIRLNGKAFTVVGVAAESYRGMLPGLTAEFWAPAMMIGTFMPDDPGALTSRSPNGSPRLSRRPTTATR